MNLHILRERIGDPLFDTVLLLVLCLASFFLGVLVHIAYQQTIRQELQKAVITERATLTVRP